jgi:hypothetical protein
VQFFRYDIMDILSSKGVRVQAYNLASMMMGTVISIELAGGPITLLYTRNLYHTLNNITSLKCRASMDNVTLNEPFFWKDVPRLRIE